MQKTISEQIPGIANNSSDMRKRSSVLVVDDDAFSRELLCHGLNREEYVFEEAGSAREALDKLKTGDFMIVLIDLIMPDMDGLDLLLAIREAKIDTIPIVCSSCDNINMAVEAMKNGAVDFVEKSGDPEYLNSALLRATKQYNRNRRNQRSSTIFKQWDAAFNAVPDLIAILDNNHRMVKINDALARKMNCTPEQAVGQLCRFLVQNEAACGGKCPFRNQIMDPKAITTSVTNRIFGGIYHVFVSNLEDHKGKRAGCIHVMHDITPEVETRAELERAHDETKRLMDSMTSFLIEVDSDLVVHRWNNIAEETFGETGSETLGKSMLDLNLSWKLEINEDLLNEWLSATEPRNISDVQFARTDGTEGIIAFTINPIIQDGQSFGFFILGKDITERMQLKTQLNQAQKLESIGQLAAGIAHEINTPIQYIGDNLEFLLTAFEDLEVVHEAFEKLHTAVGGGGGGADKTLLKEINESVEDIDLSFFAEQVPSAIKQSIEGVERISSIVGAMKKFSHPGVEEKTHIDLNDCIQSTVTVARNEWKYVAEVEFDLASDLPQVPCLPGEFNQVILNIVINAAHAIADVVEESAAQLGKITVTTRLDGDHVEVSISDTGTGIPKEHRERIFDPFFTTKAVGKGTGQGLAIAHSVIVDKHNGTLTCESSEGRGTTFTIRMPLTADSSKVE